MLRTKGVYCVKLELKSCTTPIPTIRINIIDLNISSNTTVGIFVEIIKARMNYFIISRFVVYRDQDGPA